MIERYSRPEMAAIWSEEHKLAVWKEVETLVVEAWVAEGVAPPEAAAAVRRAPEVDPTAWKEREKITNHDVAAFVDLLAESTETGGEWVHFGLTSSDVLDTAQGAILKDAANLLLCGLRDLFAVVQRRAFEHRGTVMIGRTHGIWAEPTSFGLKLANWAFEISRNYDRLARARDVVAVGKISGAVGTYAHTPPSVEAFVCERLGIGIEPASTQITHRDRHAEFVTTLALIASGVERVATEIRHLQRSEVGEVHEAFRSGQKGSSAMPHKRNPIASENATGMARLLRGNASAALENIALWHERDISHSGVERVILPDSCLAVDYTLAKMTGLIDNLVVDSDRMLSNLDSTQGLVFSQAVLLALIETGLSRDESYRIVQRNAMTAWDTGAHLKDLLLGDMDVTLSDEVIESCFAPQRFLHNTGVVFDRLAAVTLDS